MKYLLTQSKYPLEYISSGILTSGPGFVHLKRTLKEFVFILVLKGTLPITQEDRTYLLKENEFILLFGDTNHYGHEPCPDHLSYYWVHFALNDPDYRICTAEDIPREYTNHNRTTSSEYFPQMNYFFIPEHGALSAESRSPTVFSNLISTAISERHHRTWRCHYALSSLLLEVTYDIITTKPSYIQNTQLDDVIAYIHSNYEKELTVSHIAEHFNYSPTYLTKIMKNYTGYSLIVYINRTRIEAAKNLLRNSDATIQNIALMCGFENEKYFFRVFKNNEGISPLKYRKKKL